MARRGRWGAPWCAAAADGAPARPPAASGCSGGGGRKGRKKGKGKKGKGPANRQLPLPTSEPQQSSGSPTATGRRGCWRPGGALRAPSPSLPAARTRGARSRPVPGSKGGERSGSLLPLFSRSSGSGSTAAGENAAAKSKPFPCVFNPLFPGRGVHLTAGCPFAVAVNPTRTWAGERLGHGQVAVNVPQTRPMPCLPGLPPRLPSQPDPAGAAGPWKPKPHLAPSSSAGTGCWLEGPRPSGCWRRRARSRGFGARRREGSSAPSCRLLSPFVCYLRPLPRQRFTSASNSARGESRRISFFAFLRLP